MLKNSFRALVVVTGLALPCISFGANLVSGNMALHAAVVSSLDPSAPVPKPIFKTKTSLDPSAPVPKPIFKTKTSLDPSAPVPKPIFKTKTSLY